MSDPSPRPELTPERARRLRLLGMTLIAALALLAGTLVIDGTTATRAAAAQPAILAGAIARPGTNLLRNPDGTAGDTSAQGWDAVTIPSASPARYTISAWLGGTRTSAATLTVRFRAASGAVAATRAIGPVGRRRRPVLQRRAVTGTLPAGVVSAEVTLTLATTLTNVDGPYAPLVGYDYASAAGLSLTVSAPAQPPAPLTPPTPRVPRYQHVFLFYFENEDYDDIIGNVRQAPFLNSLRKQGATLADFYAEEHPSDANYLAFAGGSTCGVPLDDPEEENSPAWRTQRSLAIITFDEDATDGQRPAQRIPTLVIASQGVRPGYTDPTRYTHYSLLRTVEAALGLGTLTANDLYAPAFNNTFQKPPTTRKPSNP
jgi:hypothetical protein